ncbi:MAG: hypothetical protein KC419_20190 [Anaerolineales bacterium]|nr:hypothetical protein [Anaerolineales bacterium]MCA9930821.1 hypothetical protein [Anaerolineales bacterium]
MGRILGFALIGGGIIVGIIIIVLMSVYRGENSLSAGAATLGAAIGIIVLVLPQLGVGTFLLWKGRQETAVAAKANQQRKLLDMVKSRGQIDISDLVIELGSSKSEVHDMIHQVVGMGLFAGYINWDEGMLYSRQAVELKEMTNCYNCNGELQLAGKGVIRCPYCGTEYYLD